MSYEEVGYSSSYVVGSLPRDFGYAEDSDINADITLASDLKPKILLMGLRRSGKSSIQKVVFHKMSPNETLFLESTNKLTRDDVSTSSFIQFQIWDFPGQIDFFDPAFDADALFGRQCEALIFVLDAQDDYIDALEKLHVTVTKAYRISPATHFEVFIHKVDGLSDDHKIDTQRDIQRRANDDLADEGLDEIKLSFHLTSIYDHSIFEAFSKVVQKLIPQLPTLENLLNIFIANSAVEKAFLFDVVSKIYVATDSSPVDMSSYELCCDFIDVVVDISYIYGLRNDEFVVPASTATSVGAFDELSSSGIRLNNGTVLYLREVNQYLALVCLLREESFQQQGIINYNFHCLRRAIQDTLALHDKSGQNGIQTSSNNRGSNISRYATTASVGTKTADMDDGKALVSTATLAAVPLMRVTPTEQDITDGQSDAIPTAGAKRGSVYLGVSANGHGMFSLTTDEVVVSGENGTTQALVHVDAGSDKIIRVD